MVIIKKRIDDISPASYNPRVDLRPGDIEYDKLRRSIEEFGYIDPIIYNKRTGAVVGGHQRLKVLRDLGYDYIDVVEVDLDDNSEKALNIALNKVSGDWDNEKLVEILKELEADGYDVDLTGFDSGEIDSLLASMINDIEDDIDDEDDGSDEDGDIDDLEKILKDAIDNTKAKKGDIYKLGNHFLMCGDSTSKSDIEALFNGAHINLVLTDPPYGVNIVGGKTNKVGGDAQVKFKSHAHDTVVKGKLGSSNIVKANVYIHIKGDDTTDTAKLNYDIIKGLSDNQIIFGGNYFTDFLPPKSCWLCWDKKVVANFADFELAWTSYSKAARLYSYTWSGMTREGNRKEELKKRVHPTQKPVGLLYNIISDFCDKNSIVADCFGGSGSTLIACEKFGIPCYMMEYEPYYIDVIIKRWEEYTGKQAEFIRNIEAGDTDGRA